MQQVANGFNNKIIEVIEAADEVNRRPAGREYRPDSASIIRVANDSLDALNVVDAEIKAAEDSLCAKYELKIYCDRMMRPPTLRAYQLLVWLL
jgi:hypothetical protein